MFMSNLYITMYMFTFALFCTSLHKAMRFSSSKQILVWFEPAEDHMDMEVEKKAETRY